MLIIRTAKMLLITAMLLCGCRTTMAQGVTPPLLVRSPDNRLSVTVDLTDLGQATFTVRDREQTLVTANLGLDFADSGRLEHQLKVVGTKRHQHRESYPIAVGKTSNATDHHHELVVSFREQQPPLREFDVVFRVFDDGVAFRYQMPAQQPAADFVLLDEHTLLSFHDDPVTHRLPLQNFTTSYEEYYQSSRVSEVAADELIGLPLLLEHPTGVWMALTEASLTDYAGMYVSVVDHLSGTFASRLSPLPDRKDNAKVIASGSFQTPWRVIMIADDPGRLIESNLVFHLNDRSKIEDTSWIKPGKTTFPWWNHYVLKDVDFEPGVNTATMKHYIDFCAEQGVPYHSLDGLDIAWYGGPIRPDGPTDVTTAAPSIDMPEVLRYAKEKGVRLRLWMHWKALQPQLDEAFAIYEKWGIEGVMIDFMDRDDQEMVRWYHEVARKAAEHHLTVTWHGAYKPTGMERTWPNVLSYEGVLNQEYNKWDPKGLGGTPPVHNLNVAFIRMLAGPLDYHQGGMRNELPDNFHFSDVAPPVQGTRGHQYAMYIVYQNHLPMMADYPAAYRGQVGLDFLVDIPTTWDEIRVLHAEMGKCLVIARRSGTSWFVGGMTAEEPRTLHLPLDFLGEGSFHADVYTDDTAKGPTALLFSEQTSSSNETFDIAMPASGGFVARFSK